MKPLLEILDLSIEFRPPRGAVEPVIAVRHISLCDQSRRDLCAGRIDRFREDGDGAVARRIAAAEGPGDDRDGHAPIE